MSMIRITISTGNDAFGHQEFDGSQDAIQIGAEVARILRRMADQFEEQGSAGNVLDINGHQVGVVETIK